MLAVEVGEKLADFGALGVAVGGAGGFDDGELSFGGEIADVFFGHIDHGANEMQVGAGQVGYGLEAPETSLEEQVEHEGVHYIVKMVTKGYAVTAKLFGGVVEYAAAHFGAERAGVGLLAHVKDDLSDLGWGDVVGHLQLVAELADGGEVHGGGKAHVHGDGAQVEFLGIESAQVGEGTQEGQ